MTSNRHRWCGNPAAVLQDPLSPPTAGDSPLAPLLTAHCALPHPVAFIVRSHRIAGTAGAFGVAVLETASRCWPQEGDLQTSQHQEPVQYFQSEAMAIA